MISLITVALSVAFSIVMLFVLDLGEAVEETSVGFIYLGSYTEEQYPSVLSSRITQWQDTADYQLIYQGYEFDIDLTLFDFNLTATIDNIKTNMNNKAHFVISSTNESILMDAFQENLTPTLFNAFDKESFLEAIITDMSSLKNRKVYQLKSYLGNDLDESIIHSVIMDQIALSDLNQILSAVESFEILAASRFSLLNTLGKISSLNNNQLSIIASALQRLTLETHFEGFIFSSYRDLPIWAEPGMNARILKVNQFDFSFYNRITENYKVEIEKVSNDSLAFILKGYPYMTSYVATIDDSIEIPYKIDYIDNPLIDETTPEVIISETDSEFIYELIITPGIPGKVISYFKTITQFNGESTTVKVYEEQYAAIPEIREQNVVIKDGE